MLSASFSHIHASIPAQLEGLPLHSKFSLKSTHCFPHSCCSLGMSQTANQCCYYFGFFPPRTFFILCHLWLFEWYYLFQMHIICFCFDSFCALYISRCYWFNFLFCMHDYNFSLHKNKEHLQEGTAQFFKMLIIVKIVSSPQQLTLILEVQMLPDNTF